MDRVDNPADLVPARDYIGAIVSGIILLFGAALLVTKTMKPLPELEALQEFEATVAEVIRVRPKWLRLADLFRERIERYDVRFIGRSARYRYSWLAPSQESVAELKVGDRAHVWSDVGKTYTIYQLDRGGSRLVNFEAELDRLRGDRRANLRVFTPLLLLLSGLSFWTFGRVHYRHGTRWQKRAMNPENTP